MYAHMDTHTAQILAGGQVNPGSVTINFPGNASLNRNVGLDATASAIAKFQRHDLLTQRIQ